MADTGHRLKRKRVATITTNVIPLVVDLLKGGTIDALPENEWARMQKRPHLDHRRHQW